MCLSPHPSIAADDAPVAVTADADTPLKAKCKAHGSRPRKFSDAGVTRLGRSALPCALLATKDHVNLFLYDGGIVPDPEGIITAGHVNKTARTISFYCGDTINAPALTAMLQQIIANNRAGGWRKLKRDSGR
jgi:hypothetical protein